MFAGLDKVIHLSIFAFLGFCLMVSFPKLKFPYFMLIIFGYGLLTEVLQKEMGLGRSFELYDILADLIGASLGWLFYKYIFPLFSRYIS